MAEARHGRKAWLRRIAVGAATLAPVVGMTVVGAHPAAAASPPRVAAVSPNSGSVLGGQSVTITGARFRSPVVSVLFGTVPAATFLRVSNHSITATSPPHAPGAVDVTVVSAAGTSAAAASDQFTYAGTPTVTSVSPATGPTEGGNQVTITGADLTGANAVLFGTVPAASFSVTTGTGPGSPPDTINAVAPVGSGTVDVTVSTPVGTSAASPADRYTFSSPPVVSSISPSSGPVPGGNTVTVTGADLGGATEVDFGPNAAAITAGTATSITVTAPPGTVGTVDVTVVTPSGTSPKVAGDQFAYDATVPSAPTDVVAMASGVSGAKVQWTRADNNGSPITGNLLNEYEGATRVAVVDVGDFSSFSVANLDRGALYTFTVTAINGVGQGPESAPSFPLAVEGLPFTSTTGYRVVASNGAVAANGFDARYGPTSPPRLNAPIVGIASTADDRGYWLAAADGGVFAYGDAPFYGSMGGKVLNAPIVGIAASHDSRGYWLVASDGGVFSFGDAVFRGSRGGKHLNAPVVGVAGDSRNGGYWLVASDGGIFAFGGAPFYGSTGGRRLNAPVVGMAATSDHGGYWLVASDGGIFTFGDAGFAGSMGGRHLNAPVVGMEDDSDTGGYWLVGSDGGVFAFGAPFYGSDSRSGPGGPEVAINS